MALAPRRASTTSTPARRELTPRHLATVLADVGVDPKPLHIGRHRQAGRNRLFVVGSDPGTPLWIAKQTTGDRAAECWFYSEASIPLSFVPKCLAASSRDSITITEYVAAESLQEIGSAEPGKALALHATLAPLLAELHALSRFGTAPSAVIPVLQVDPVDAYFLASASPAAADLLARIQSRPRLTRALKQIFRRPGPTGLIHGDLKADNVLSRCPPQSMRHRKRPRLTIIDWELCGRGPLGWDLGSVIGSMVTLWARNVALSDGAEPADWIAAGRVAFDSLHRAVRTFVSSYLDHASDRVSIAPRACVSAFAAAWMVSRMLVEAAQAYRPSATHALLLIIAEQLCVDPFELFGDLSW